MNLDVRTIYIAMAATCFIVAISLFIFQAGRLRRDGNIYWTIGWAFQGAFGTLLGLRGVIWDFFSIVVAHTFLTASFSFLYMAVREFQGRRYNRGLVLFPTLATFGFFWYFSAYADELSYRIIFISLLSILQNSVLAWALLRDAPGYQRRSYWLTGFAFFVYALVFLSRLIEAFTVSPEQISILMATPLRNVSILMVLGVAIFSSIGFVLMMRVLVEEVVVKSEERYRELYDYAPIGYLEYDAQGKITIVNRAVMDLLGYTAPEMIGQPVWEFNADHEASRGRILAKLSGTLSPDKNIEHQYRRKDGIAFPVSILNRPIQDEEGKIKGMRCTIQDITQPKKAEEEKTYLLGQLHQSQKMEAIGTLAGGIAHDFNNILAVILGYAELAKVNLPDRSRARYDIQQSIEAAQRAKSLVQQILAFSRSNKQERKSLRIQRIIKDGLGFLRASLPSTIQIQQDIEEDLGVIEGDSTQVYQVLMNLCTNASHAMAEKGGVLEVSLNKVDLTARESAGLVGVKPGLYVRLRVRDTGHGMSPEILKKIFDPYFTTKEIGIGTGLGLALVQRIVKSHGGGVGVSSEVGKGSTFNIYFPLVDGDGDHSGAEKVEPLPLGSHEWVLFVDDEQAIVEVGKGILEHLGYEVVSRTSSLEALELLRMNPERFDVVITDMTMPNLAGDRLAQEILGIRPDLPIILCTGFSENITEEKAKALGIRELVMKPLAMKDIAETMRRVLNPPMKEKD